MNDLIKITNKKGKETVNARDLHEFLESKQDFSTWIKNRIEKYEFMEKSDYVAIPQKYGTANGGYSIRNEYFLTVEMAKELSMVENNEKGKQARRYFIQVEKAYREHTKIRGKSKKIRSNFTDCLKEHGYTKPHEYIQTTKQMKQALGITHKKDEMTTKELKKILVAETLSELQIEDIDAQGYYEVNPVCVETSNLVTKTINKQITNHRQDKNHIEKIVS